MARPDGCSAQKLGHPDTWTASNPGAPGHTRRMLIQEFKCVRGRAGSFRARRRRPSARRHPSSSAAQQTCLTATGDEDASKLLEQCRVTAQILRHWAQHTAIEDKPPSATSAQMLALQRAQVIDAIYRIEGATWATRSHSRTRPTKRILTASQPRGGNFDIRHPRGSGASTSLAHGRWRSANLP